MNHEITELIRKAYDIAQNKNHSFTFQEAILYDPLISTLYKALRKIEALEKPYEICCECGESVDLEILKDHVCKETVQQ